MTGRQPKTGQFLEALQKIGTGGSGAVRGPRPSGLMTWRASPRSRALTRQSQTKRFREARATAILDKAEGRDFRWIYDPDREHLSRDVLAELGRLATESTIIEAAEVVCKNRLRSRSAIALLPSGGTVRPYPATRANSPPGLPKLSGPIA